MIYACHCGFPEPCMQKYAIESRRIADPKRPVNYAYGLIDWRNPLRCHDKPEESKSNLLVVSVKSTVDRDNNLFVGPVFQTELFLKYKKFDLYNLNARYLKGFKANHTLSGITQNLKIEKIYKIF
uniref:Uncharacterized protein n=1 Tax=Romanomermis culicivorax TaxID=13658 RepID=A0A915IAK6_ROMCU